MQKLFMSVAFCIACPVYGMHLVKNLGAIDKRLIMRHVQQVGTKNLLTKLKSGQPAKLMPPHPAQVVDKALYTHVPAACIRLYCCNPYDVRPSLEPLSNGTYSHAERTAIENLAIDMFKKIAAVEKKSGYIPETFVQSGPNSITVIMANNRLCEQTHYWHLGHNNQSRNATCIVTETKLYREHYEEVEELLKKQFTLP